MRLGARLRHGVKWVPEAREIDSILQSNREYGHNENTGGAMSNEQILLFTIMGATLALFIWGRIRFDVVAILALLAT